KVAPVQSWIVLDCCQRIGRVHWSSVASDHFFPWVENAAYARFKIPSGDWESGSFVLYCESMSAADGAPPEVDTIPAKILNRRSRIKQSRSHYRTIRFLLPCLLFPFVCR